MRCRCRCSPVQACRGEGEVIQGEGLQALHPPILRLKGTGEGEGGGEGEGEAEGEGFSKI